MRKWAPLGLFILPSLGVCTILVHGKGVTGVLNTVPWLKVIRARWITYSPLPEKHPDNCSCKNNWFLTQERASLVSSNVCPQGFIFLLLVECTKSSVLLCCVLCSQPLAALPAPRVSALAQTYPEFWRVTRGDHPRTREPSNAAGLERDPSPVYRGRVMP